MNVDVDLERGETHQCRVGNYRRRSRGAWGGGLNPPKYLITLQSDKFLIESPPARVVKNIFSGSLLWAK